MKKSLLFLSAIMVLMTSCKKDEEKKVDDRDQFVGTYFGSLTINVPAMESTDTLNGVIIIIAKSSEASKIVISDGTEIRKAVVSGNKYEYEKFTKTVIVEGTTITMELTGSGTIKNGKITESGPMTISFLSASYPGTWTSSFTKQ